MQILSCMVVACDGRIMGLFKLTLFCFSAVVLGTVHTLAKIARFCLVVCLSVNRHCDLP